MFMLAVRSWQKKRTEATQYNRTQHEAMGRATATQELEAFLRKALQRNTTASAGSAAVHSVLQDFASKIHGLLPTSVAQYIQPPWSVPPPATI